MKQGRKREQEGRRLPDVTPDPLREEGEPKDDWDDDDDDDLEEDGDDASEREE